jgi:hypothetical protein
MLGLLTNWAVWLRMAVVGSVAWFLIIMLTFGFRNDFYMSYSANPEMALIVGFAGMIAIWVICLGVPWIAGAAVRKADKR